MDSSSNARKVMLLERKRIINQKIDQKARKKIYTIVLSIILICIGVFLRPLAGYYGMVTLIDKKIIFMVSLTSIFYGTSIFFSTFVVFQNIYKTDLQEIENELDLLSISLSSEEERAEKLFKHHHVELKKYYDENLKQSSWIFIVGIICIIAGFSIIAFTLYLLYNNMSNQIENKIIIASIGAIGAILTNFIAVVFLKMHAETVKSLTEFHNRFVNTHHFYFGNFLISKVKNEEKREEALISLSLNINGSNNLDKNSNEKETV
ncbi:hypothetical protein [Exiguobacterium sp. s133]|uniref:TRADD-N-associated membrane domain-containing protein n=1 Tax=Exiguobacterium sp. s133 TaxID=2751213 RepID=UPI002036DD01|nr:hypothetical protein [Exiguobacterium sp. s133]